MIRQRGIAGKKPVTVWVHPGTYHFSRTFRLEAEDSGSAGAPIIYRAVPGAEVILKGSIPLNPRAWKKWKDGIYRQSLKGTPLEKVSFNQLFLNNKRMVRARYPNWDYSNPLCTGRGYLHAVGGTSMKKICFRPEDLAGRRNQWRNPQTGIVHAFHSHNWGNFQFQIDHIDWDRHTIIFKRGGWQAQRRNLGVGQSNRRKPGSPFYIENIFEELDAPCEWFLDTAQAMLYFKPPANVKLEDALVEAAAVRRIIEVEGASHIVFKGFHITQSMATFMEPYSDLARGDWAIHRGGAVYFHKASHCRIEDCHIEQVGGNAVFVDGFNREIHISGCLIEDTGDSAVCFVGRPDAVRNYQTWERPCARITDFKPGPKSPNYPARCSVRNCILRDVGVYGKQTSGVIVSMAMEITIDHCSIYRIARAAVTFNDGTWGGHVMSNCDIYDAVLDTGEHGPFNAWGRERYWNGKKLNKKLVLLDAIKPNILHHNRIGNYRPSVSAGNWTIDLDDGASNFEIHHNLMLGSALKLRDGYYRKVWNNIIVGPVPLGFHVWPNDNSEDVFKHNIVVVAGTPPGTQRQYQEVIRPIRMPPDHGLWGTIDENLWWNVNSKKFYINRKINDLEKWKTRQGRHDVFADPMFIDPLHRDYRVKPDSPALALGFENFPMDTFGHQMTRIIPGSCSFVDAIDVIIRPDKRGGQVRYTLDGSLPRSDSTLYSGPIHITRSTTIWAATFDANGHRVGFPDKVELKKVKRVSQPSWLASLLAGRLIKTASTHSSPAPEKRSKPLFWAGLRLVDIADYPDYIDASGGQTFGAFVLSVQPGSPGERAGIKEGDTIINVEGINIDTLEDLRKIIHQHPGPIRCRIFRGYHYYRFTIPSSKVDP
ncbi:MAG: PDZ domain-containing protein [Lentisphaerae bacterium]|nr:MAG: PDZ domain-containing protein [Lentisphaerota bacterium]